MDRWNQYRKTKDEMFFNYKAILLQQKKVRMLLAYIHVGTRLPRVYSNFVESRF